MISEGSCDTEDSMPSQEYICIFNQINAALVSIRNI